MSEEKEKEQWERPDREEVIRDNPLLEYCQRHGLQLKRDGAANRYKCLCPLHREKTPSFTVFADQNRYHCFGCGADGKVIDLHMALKGMSDMEALCDLAGVEYHAGKGGGSVKREKREAGEKPPSQEAGSANGSQGSRKSGEPRGKETACYDYQDATGAVVFEVVRYEPKGFRQCHIVDGRRVWNMDGVERVPYRLPELLSSPASVWIVEGERDAETLCSIGQTATCNPGGTGKWLPAYSQYLKGQYVYLVPDNDEPGQKHARAVLASLAGLVEWVKWVELPREFNGKFVKDISDLREACGSDDAFFEQLEALQKKARLIERGVESAGRTIAELEDAYKAMLSSHGALLMLGNWLPKLGVRGLAPGDMLGLVADTGNLKTASLLNILAHNADLPAVIFSLELGESQMFERIAAISARREIEEIEQTYRAGRTVDWRKSQRFRDVLVYTDSMTMAEIDEEVSRSSAKLGCEPKIVAIDYVQLVNARERGPRYERFSDACESARRLAKKHHCVVIVLSQVARDNNSKDGGVREITIHDAKETGSFENSCSLLLGLWKISKTQMKCRVLKNSLGLAGNTVTMDIRGGTFIIDPAKGSL